MINVLLINTEYKKMVRFVFSKMEKVNLKSSFSKGVLKVYDFYKIISNN